jgi:excisionase family DNA binding protein
MRLWLNASEAAEYADVSRDTSYTACARRELPHVRIRGRRSIRLKAEWIDAWRQRHPRRAKDLFWLTREGVSLPTKRGRASRALSTENACLDVPRVQAPSADSAPP